MRHSELSYLLLVTLAYYQTQVKWSGRCIIGRPGGGETAERREDGKRASAEMSEEKTREGGVETVGRKWREADCRWEEETGRKSG